MKPALIARLLVEEYSSMPDHERVIEGAFRFGCVSISYRPNPRKLDYLYYLKSIASGKQRNSNVVRGYRAAVQQIEG